MYSVNQLILSNEQNTLVSETSLKINIYYLKNNELNDIISIGRFYKV